jgi:hypothetical protein
MNLEIGDIVNSINKSDQYLRSNLRKVHVLDDSFFKEGNYVEVIIGEFKGYKYQTDECDEIIVDEYNKMFIKNCISSEGIAFSDDMLRKLTLEEIKNFKMKLKIKEY